MFAMIPWKLQATLWKCLKIRRRHYIVTLFVFFMPMLLFGLLAWGRSKIGHIGKQYVNESTYIEPMSEEALYLHFKVDVSETQLLYTPKTAFSDELMQYVRIKMDILNDKFFGFDTQTELIEHFQKFAVNVPVYAVVFNHLQGDAAPNVLDYGIRSHENWETDERFNPLRQYVPDAGSGSYFNKAFLNLQLAIDRKFLQMKHKTLDVAFAFQEFPYPPHYNDIGFQELFMTMLPLVTLFSTIFTFPGTLKRMLEEKQTGIKELMKMMGVPPSIMYLAWFIDALIPILISAVVCTLLMKIPVGTDFPPIEYSNGLIFGLFLILYFTSCVAFCLFIGTLSNSPPFTTTIGILIWIVTYILPFSWKNLMNQGYVSLLLCIVPNIAMYKGFSAICNFEGLGVGVQWHNLFESATGNETEVVMGEVLLMLLLDIVLLLLLGFYLDQVRPGHYGLPKPWNYPLTALYNFVRKSSKLTKRRNSVGLVMNNEPNNVEECCTTPGIVISNMTKRYGNLTAVDNISVTFYQGEIAAVLGKNGAGKTTTMSVMTGMTQASHGTVLINGEDINESLSHIRSIMGICPQHDLLFPELTVFEHVLFFAKIKHIGNAAARVNALLSELNLFDAKDKMPNQISGGMKRKLCLAMAIIANPKVLVMDEPTSGLDPQSRRELWDLILKWRTEHPDSTILVSTHFMEEADVLGDRITVIEKGRLLAQGTPMFLTKRFGDECKLSLILADGSDDHQLQNALVASRVVLLSRDENVYTIGMGNDKANAMHFLQQIENCETIQKAGISIPSMEEVFLKLADSASLTRDHADGAHLSYIEIPTSSSADGLEQSLPRVTFWTARFAVLQQLCRYLTYWVMAFALVLLLMRAGGKQKAAGPSTTILKFDLSAYGKTKVYYSIDPSIPNQATFGAEFEKIVRSQGSDPFRVDSVSEGLLKVGVNNLEAYKTQFVVALEVNVTSDNGILVNMMYSNSALHGAPIILDMAMDMMAKIVGDGGISTANVPLKSKEEAVVDVIASDIQIVILWVILMPIALLILVSGFLHYPLIERVSNFKHLIYMTGQHPLIYWLNMFVFHYFLYLLAITSICILVFFTAMYESAAMPLFLILLCYGCMMIPCVFVFSYKKSVAAAVGSLTILTIFSGIVLTSVVMVLQFYDDPSWRKIGNALDVVFCASPQYWVTARLITLSRKAMWLYQWTQMTPEMKETTCRFTPNPCCAINGKVNESECAAYKGYLNSSELTKVLVPTIVMFALYMLLLWMLDSYIIHVAIDKCVNAFHRFFRKKTYMNLIEVGSDHDVVPQANSRAQFRAMQLQKVFSDKVAVRNLSFSVKKGQCYGLLGINGAGKSTTFNMLTGYLIPTAGDAVIAATDEDYSSLSQKHATYLRDIGYCAQFNAINEILTPRVLLGIFARLRDVPLHEVECRVQNLLELLNLSEFADVASSSLSGGNKRKLCLGIALIGEPKMCFLDEPTTGVDPVSRRMIWDVLQDLKTRGVQSLVLTSHSMDECELLCDELAIMKAGEVSITGNIQELKMKYGQGLTIKMKLLEMKEYTDAVDGGDSSSFKRHHVQEKMQQIFADYAVELKDQHEGYLHYIIKNAKCTPKELRQFMEEMEKLKSQYPNVVDYTINTATLEDIFLGVARQFSQD